MVRLESLLRLEHFVDTLELRIGGFLRVSYARWYLTVQSLAVGIQGSVIMRVLAVWWCRILRRMRRRSHGVAAVLP
jgi:hypothetical protein